MLGSYSKLQDCIHTHEHTHWHSQIATWILSEKLSNLKGDYSLVPFKIVIWMCFKGLETLILVHLLIMTEAGTQRHFLLYKKSIYIYTV